MQKNVNINLVLQNTHKLTVTLAQKKEPYFKTRFPVVLYTF